MLKGHSRIELKNVENGEIKIYEQDNIITNAVSKNISTVMKMTGYGDINSKFLPLHSKAMGGILLFQENLDVSVNNTALPSPIENPLIGYAGDNSYNGSDTRRGSRNGVESKEIENGYKFVWDFATSQANGLISALALTSAECGKTPFAHSEYYIDRSMATSTVTNYMKFSTNYDFEKNIMTCVYPYSTTRIDIVKLRIPIDQIRLTTSLMVPEIINIESVELSDSGITINANVNYFRGADSEDYYYIFYKHSSLNIIKFFRINKSTLDIDESFGENTVNKAFSFEHNNPVILGSYAYTCANGIIYKVNINDTNDYSEISTGQSGYAGGSSVCNGGIWTNTYIYYENISGLNPIIIPRPNASSYTSRNLFVSDTDIEIGIRTYSNTTGGNGIYLTYYTPYSYLASVNNLNTSVIKTSAQTMKIIYTLQEV